MIPTHHTTLPPSAISGTRKHGLRRRLSTAALACAALVILSECALRFGLGLGSPVLIQPDPACDYILKPNQDLVRFFCHTHINRYGMRSDEVPIAPAPHTLRVMFVGDSITYGTSAVDQSRIFSEIVHRDLPVIALQPVEVLNASANAWAIDNELSYVRSRGIFRSDVVLLILNSGDLSQPRSTIAQVGNDLRVKRPATAIGELYSRAIAPHLFHLQSNNEAGDSPVEGADSVVQSNLNDLEAFRLLVVSQHARFAIVYTPFRRDIPNYSIHSAKTLGAWATAHQVPLLDLTAVESLHSASEITRDGMHFNDKGNQLVAKEIERFWPTIDQPH